MPTHIREFNRLEQHLSHDLVFKLVNQFSRGTTGILILRNIKFKILPSINPSLSDFTGFFALKTNQTIAIFVWIFTCVDFRGMITTQVCRNRVVSWCCRSPNDVTFSLLSTFTNTHLGKRMQNFGRFVSTDKFTDNF